MKIAFYYFSGTGNTRRACNLVATELKARGHEADLYAIRTGEEIPSPQGYDGIVLGYPVHAFNAPTPVLKFLKKLPKCDGKPCYLLRTSGEPVKMNHASRTVPVHRLKKAGYEVKGEFPYVMPYNIIFRHSDEMAARMWRAAQLAAPVDAQAIINGEGKLYPVNPFFRFASFLLRIEHPAMPVFGVSFHAKKKKCVGCEVCVKVCPMHNIKMKNGKPKFGKHCVACMGCAFSCPKDAVRPSILNAWRVNGVYSLGATPATDEQICKYCRKAYLRYFHEIEEGKR